jgi:hypothetical protein
MSAQAERNPGRWDAPTPAPRVFVGGPLNGSAVPAGITGSEYFHYLRSTLMHYRYDRVSDGSYRLMASAESVMDIMP